MNIFLTNHRTWPLVYAPRETVAQHLAITAEEAAYHAAISCTDRFRRINAGVFLKIGRMLVQMLKTFSTFNETITVTLRKNQEVSLGRRISRDCLEEGTEIPLTGLGLFDFLVHFYEAYTFVLTIRGQRFIAKLEWTHLRPQTLFLFAVEYDHTGALKHHLLRYTLLRKRHRELFRTVYGKTSVDALRTGTIRQIERCTW